jgi:hypothetical protein
MSSDHGSVENMRNVDTFSAADVREQTLGLSLKELVYILIIIEFA